MQNVDIRQNPRFLESLAFAGCGSIPIEGGASAPDGHPNSPVYGHLKLPHLN